VIAAAFSDLYLTLWFSWRSGSKMQSSEWGRMYKESKITVRRLPSSAPFWAVPLSFLPDDNPRYWCEFFRFGSSILFSAQTYQGESFTAQTARIEWNDAGGATVYLDNDPVMECDSEGFGSKAH
jgi:hypothetical protein